MPRRATAYRSGALRPDESMCRDRPSFTEEFHTPGPMRTRSLRRLTTSMSSAVTTATFTAKLHCRKAGASSGRSGSRYWDRGVPPLGSRRSSCCAARNV
ncbi:hypothetical protein J7E96_18635 [Streptomyces sp. ISL-96]|uniref:hypothetical protein n=1 Tax=Streptomyces sp. ISL-96 TaxID=2819191 RepID=UPI001BE6525A|nr:hypothetical protein [Streptomyces sp. ISL-96]MBT2490496.1 hypothetical protein [Streptomyces sp. ISL-96]